MLDVERIIHLLNLRPLPAEGGEYAETYRADQTIPREALPARYTGPRRLSTAIYYLLRIETFSAIHRLPTDEIFHHYFGDPVEQLQLHPDGSGEIVLIGSDLEAGMRPQMVAPAGVWQGARLRAGGSFGFALMGTTMAPGFDIADYEAGARAGLIERYPAFRDLIVALTRD